MNCLHCGSTDVDELLRDGPRVTFRCRACGGFYNDPGRDTAALYDRSYFVRHYVRQGRLQVEESRHYLHRLRRHVAGGSILDYGCGTGVFLGIAEEYGFRDNVGADVSADALRIARRAFGERIRWLRLPEERLPDRRFEVIALLNSLTALKNARETVLALKRDHLAENGLVVVRTPRIPASYLLGVARLARAFRVPRASGLLFAKVRYLVFDAGSLRRFLGSLGLEIVHFEARPEYPFPMRRRSVGAFLKTGTQRLLTCCFKSMFVIARSGGGRGFA